jgi:predicted permease
MTLLEVQPLADTDFAKYHNSLQGISPKAAIFFFVLFIIIAIGFWLIVRNVKKKSKRRLW